MRVTSFPAILSKARNLWTHILHLSAQRHRLQSCKTLNPCEPETNKPARATASAARAEGMLLGDGCLRMVGRAYGGVLGGWKGRGPAIP